MNYLRKEFTERLKSLVFKLYIIEVKGFYLGVLSTMQLLSGYLIGI